MKKNEKLIIQGNEFYILDLDCLERKKKEQPEKTAVKVKPIPKKSLYSK